VITARLCRFSVHYLAIRSRSVCNGVLCCSSALRYCPVFGSLCANRPAAHRESY
jgi:hypothetical protein